MRNQEMIEILLNCASSCEYCADMCLEEENVAHMASCIKTDRDCADICRLTAAYLARDSRFLKPIMEACIAICKACKEECRKHDHDHCQENARACERCEKACRDHLTVLA